MLTRLWVYGLPALVATLVTLTLGPVGVLVGPIHECEECPGQTGASPEQTNQWLLALGLSIAALVVAWVVTAVVIAATVRDGRTVRALPLVIVIVVALMPVGAGVIAVAINLYNAAHPAGYWS